jgi:hypothetical protein
VALQKGQGLLIELLDLLIDWCVRALFKDQQFGVADGTRHLIRKTSRRQYVVTPKGDLRWYRDLAQLRGDIMRDDGIRCLEEIRQRLHWPAPHKFGQGLDTLAWRHIARA